MNHPPLISLDIRRSHVSLSAVEAMARTAAPALRAFRTAAEDHDYQTPAAALALPDDAALLHRVTATVASLKSASLRLVLVVGIGGSNLGTQAVVEACCGNPAWHVAPSRPQLVFVDTTESVLVHAAVDAIAGLSSPDEVAVLLISKFGTTTETVANGAVLVEALTERFGSRAASRIVAITDEQSPLWALADQEGWARIAIPAAVGGRFSVLSAVGLVPLELAGVDVQTLRQGATAMRDQCLRPDPANPALQSATVLAHQVAAKRRIHDTFVFRPQLEVWGKWYRQLAAESLGKETDRDGVATSAGFTPTVSVGSADLHAVAQRYLTGPDETVTTFLTAPGGDRVRVPADPVAKLVPDLAGKTLLMVQAAILDGTCAAYEARGKPFVRATLTRLDPAGLGALFVWKEIEVMLLAEQWNLNAFDQPAVEEYKRETRRRLAGA